MLSTLLLKAVMMTVHHRQRTKIFINSEFAEEKDVSLLTRYNQAILGFLWWPCLPLWASPPPLPVRKSTHCCLLLLVCSCLAGSPIFTQLTLILKVSKWRGFAKTHLHGSGQSSEPLGICFFNYTQKNYPEWS